MHTNFFKKPDQLKNAKVDNKQWVRTSPLDGHTPTYIRRLATKLDFKSLIQMIAWHRLNVFSFYKLFSKFWL